MFPFHSPLFTQFEMYAATLANALTPSFCTLPDLLQKLVTEVGDGQSEDLSAERDVKTIIPIFLHQERNRDSLPKGKRI